MTEGMTQTGRTEEGEQPGTVPPAAPVPLWAGIPLFKDLGSAELDAIAERLDLRPICAGEILIRQGVWAGTLFIIRTGIVEISFEHHDEAGHRRVSLRRLVAGECFGEMSLITGAPPSATARALTDGEVWTLGQPDFLQLALAQPELSRNISAILSERLLHTSRQQVSGEPAQVIVMVGAPPALTRALAAALAHLSARPTLFVDGAADPPASPAGGAGADFTLTDLLGGRLRPPAPGLPTPGENGERGPLTVVRGPGGDGAASGAGAADLSAALSRLGADYHYLFVALPFDHPALTPQLLAYATRILVVGRMADLPRVRAGLAALPLAADARTTLSIMLVDAPSRLRPTVATLELLSEEFGAPVQDILPTASPGDMAQAVLPVARWLVKQRIGLALGAGGAKGFAHIGALRALRRVGIPLDAITGTSIGAWIGAALATGKSVERLEVELNDATKHVFRPRVPLYGVSGSQALATWSRQEEIFGQRRVEDLPTPFAASAADLTDGREIVLRRGPVWRAVLASAAIPGIYPPVRIGRHWLVDGGVVNPVPVSLAQLLGADLVIAVDLSDPLKPRQEPAPGRPTSAQPPRLFTNMLRSHEIMMSEIRAHTVGEPSVLIKPRVEGLWNYHEAGRFIAAGEEATEAILPRLREQFPWLGRS